MKKINPKCSVDRWIYKNDLSIFILIIRLSLQIYVPSERNSVVMRVCVFVAQCHFFSLSLSVSLLPSLLSTMSYVHGMQALEKERERRIRFLYVCSVM